MIRSSELIQRERVERNAVLLVAVDRDLRPTPHRTGAGDEWLSNYSEAAHHGPSAVGTVFFPDFSLLLLLRPVSLPQFLEDGDLGNQSGDGITRFNGLRKFNGCCARAPSADRNDSSGENLAPLVGDPSTLCQSLTPICLPMCAPPRDKA